MLCSLTPSPDTLHCQLASGRERATHTQREGNRERLFLSSSLSYQYWRAVFAVVPFSTARKKLCDAPHTPHACTTAVRAAIAEYVINQPIPPGLQAQSLSEAGQRRAQPQYFCVCQGGQVLRVDVSADYRTEGGAAHGGRGGALVLLYVYPGCSYTKQVKRAQEL